jgi:hypothetical protein
MPNILARRQFKRPNTLRMVTPGYRDAPALGKPMTIMFVKVGVKVGVGGGAGQGKLRLHRRALPAAPVI